MHQLDESTVAPDHEGPSDESYRSQLRVPDKAAGAVAAAVGVPVLVDE